jgi:hypothetical protein
MAPVSPISTGSGTIRYAIMRRARPYRGENHGPGKDFHRELDPTPGIREQPGSKMGRQKPSSVIRYPYCKADLLNPISS